MKKISIAAIEGKDPQVMQSVLSVLEAAGANLEVHKIDAGAREALYRNNLKNREFGKEGSQNSHSERATIARKQGASENAKFEQNPTTPKTDSPGYFDIGKTEFLLNNSVHRASIGTYVTIYPSASYFPFVATQHPDMNLVVVRERAEDVYTSIEYPETPDLCIATKLTSRAGSEKTIRYAFEYAKQHGRKKVSLFIQDSILKVTDGFFHKIFKSVAESYPDILNETLPVDLGAAKLAQTPEIFDVIVTSNLYGDLLSKIAVYPLGLHFSSSFSEKRAVFEALEPSGLLLASLQMLEYMGESSLATHIHNAWAHTLEQGIHTPEIFQEGVSKQRVDVKEFCEALRRNLGKGPEHLQVPLYHRTALPSYHAPPLLKSARLVGIDIYIQFHGQLSEFFSRISHMNVGPLRLKAIFNRGNLVWPKGAPDLFCIEEWCCRFLTDGDKAVVQDDLIKILHAIDHVQIPILRSVCLSILA